MGVKIDLLFVYLLWNAPQHLAKSLVSWSVVEDVTISDLTPFPFHSLHSNGGAEPVRVGGAAAEEPGYDVAPVGLLGHGQPLPSAVCRTGNVSAHPQADCYLNTGCCDGQLMVPSRCRYIWNICEPLWASNVAVVFNAFN